MATIVDMKEKKKKPIGGVGYKDLPLCLVGDRDAQSHLHFVDSNGATILEVGYKENDLEKAKDSMMKIMISDQFVVYKDFYTKYTHLPIVIKDRIGPPSTSLCIAFTSTMRRAYYVFDDDEKNIAHYYNNEGDIVEDVTAMESARELNRRLNLTENQTIRPARITWKLGRVPYWIVNIWDKHDNFIRSQCTTFKIKTLKDVANVQEVDPSFRLGVDVEWLCRADCPCLMEKIDPVFD
jgi:hypothetical protein